jgi:predicted metal-binding transcription factor (methanogenesis marker protein 9)
MTFKAQISAVLLGVLIAAFGLSESATAGTCSPVKVKGIGKNVARATEEAQEDLRFKAKLMKGKVMQASTNCVPGLLGTVCKIQAVVCPK